MPTVPITLLAVLLVMAASAGARAEALPVLSSHICRTPSREEFADKVPRDNSTNAAQAAEDRWNAAYEAVIGRWQQGDILVLAARNAAAKMLRYCDFDRPVLQTSPVGETVCTFAGGRRELR